MNREIAFVLACLRRLIEPESAVASTSGLDWKAIIRFAAKHSITPLLYQTLVNHPPASIPPPVLAELRQSCHHAVRFNLALTAELIRILTLLQGEGIAAVTFKGPILSAMLYGNLALRAFSDFDILVHPQDVLRARSILMTHGYQCASTLHWPSESALLQARESQVTFTDSRNHIIADLHWRILPGYQPDAFDTESMWRKLRSVPVDGASISTLSAEHTVLFLCAHGAKHIWERLSWISDLARLIRLERDIDWPSVFHEAQRTATSRIVCLGLAVAENLLEIQLPPVAAERVAADAQARSLAQTVRRRIFADAPIPTPPLEALFFNLRAFQRNSHRLRFVAAMMHPCEAEYRALQLPPILYFLYYPFRPLRLIAKYGARALRLGFQE